MSPSHLILCRPLLLLPPIPPSIRVFSNESALRMRWPEYWSFSLSISPSNEHPGLISFRMDWWISLQEEGSQETPGVTGKFGLGVQNEAGQRLIEFCQENALVIANTLFEQHKRKLYTWTSPDGQHHQTDCVLCSQRWRSSIQSAKNKTGSWLWLRSWTPYCQIQTWIEESGENTRPFRYDLNQIPYDYTVEVRNRFKGLELIDRVLDKLWVEVLDIVQETGIKTIAMEMKCNKAKWLSGAIHSSLTNSCEKKISEKQRRKRKI